MANQLYSYFHVAYQLAWTGRDAQLEHFLESHEELGRLECVALLDVAVCSLQVACTDILLR